MAFDSTELRSSLRNNVPPQMRDAYDKVVVAGMKFMFDKTTHKYMQEMIQTEGPIDDKLAQGVFQLMKLLMTQSKGAFPQQLVIPAGIELMMHAADYAGQTGADEVTPELMAGAIQKFVLMFAKEAGVGEEQLMAGIGKIAELNGQPGQPAQQGA